MMIGVNDLYMVYMESSYYFSLHFNNVEIASSMIECLYVTRFCKSFQRVLHRLAITSNNNWSITLNLGLEKIKIQLIYEYFSNYFFTGCTTLLLYSFLK